MTIDIITFGCRLNSYEAEIIRQQSRKAGLEKIKEQVFVFNTCAVTAEAVRQAKQAIRKARRKNPNARIVVTGCAVQTALQDFSKMIEIDFILGNEEKLHSDFYSQISDFNIHQTEKIRVSNIMTVRQNAPHNIMVECMNGRSRAVVQIQNGCDHRCTFCIIPYGRGLSRSVPPVIVLEQIKKMSENGYKEIVLSGVDLTSYGLDLSPKVTLGQLVTSILSKIPDLPRLRLSSIDSVEIDAELFELLAYEKRLMPYLHLSLQAGDNMILKRMKRRHLREDTLYFCHDLKSKRSDIVFGADLIVGFPTETEEMFKNTCRLVNECELTHLHVFPFSPREGTPAFHMPQTKRRIIKERAAYLRVIGEHVYSKHLQKLQGTKQRVLLERGKVARCEDYTLVKIDDKKEFLDGNIIQCCIVGYDREGLRGEAINEEF